MRSELLNPCFVFVVDNEVYDSIIELREGELAIDLGKFVLRTDAETCMYCGVCDVVSFLCLSTRSIKYPQRNPSSLFSGL